MGWFSNFISLFKSPGVSPDIPSAETSLVPFEEQEVSYVKDTDIYQRISNQTIIEPRLAKLNPGQVKSRGLSFFGSLGNREWLIPQVDHTEIEVLYDIESYFARAIRAKMALFLKEGYNFISRNEERSAYIRARLKQIERATGIPLSITMYDLARNFFVHENSYLLKVRDEKRSGGKIRKVGGRTLKPIAGYFSLPPETMIPEVDTAGNILRWKQDLGSTIKYYSKDDIVHIYGERKSGYPLGVPGIISVIDDVRVLRSIEAHVDLLLHKHLFPTFLWKVGTENDPARRLESGRTEIDVVQEQVDSMPDEGSIVVSERYDVKALGAQNKALKVEGYLDYFRGRLLAGLDVSSVDVGIGDSASRSTAMTLSRNLVDNVKYKQILIQGFFEFIIQELLLESTFPEDTLFTEDNMVYLRFNEIDKEAKYKDENHAMDLFLKNGITHPELRNSLGHDPLTPEQEQELAWYKFDREAALIQSVDELSDPSRSNNPDTQEVDNKNNPQNQHGRRGGSKLNQDSFRDQTIKELPNPLLENYDLAAALIQRRASSDKNYSIDHIKTTLITYFENAIEEFLLVSLRIINENLPINVTEGKRSVIYKEARRRVIHYMNRLRKQLLNEFKEGNRSIRIIFATYRHRTKAIHSTELHHILNLSRISSLHERNMTGVIMCQHDACPECKPWKLTKIYPGDNLMDSKLPPYHPNCECWVEASGNMDNEKLHSDD